MTGQDHKVANLHSLLALSLFFNLNLHPLSPRVDLRLTSFLMVNKALLLSTTVRPKQKRRKKSQTKNERE